MENPLAALHGQLLEMIRLFFDEIPGSSEEIDGECSSKDFFSTIIRGMVKVDSVRRGAVICHFAVVPSVTNIFKGLHGGMAASIAERVSYACARTVVAEDRSLFLGELAVSYLASAAVEDEVAVEASVMRSGRNLTMVACEFKIKATGKLLYASRATFYHMSPSNL